MNYKHGLCGTPIYNKWKHMKARCLNSNNKDFKSYGGRGIKICDEWLTFTPFYEWAMQNEYKMGLDIDRIDNDGNYEPNNCQFISHIDNSQGYKKRKYKNNNSGHRGVTWYPKYNMWLVRLQHKGIKIHIGYFKDLNEAIFSQSRKEQELNGCRNN